MDNFSNGDFGTEDTVTHGAKVASVADYPEYQAAMIIRKIYPPCILLLGGFGNIATVFVMRRIKDHNSSYHAILMALAVSDFTMLYSAATNSWMRYLFGIDLQVLHVSVCKILAWIIYASSNTSAWLVTCVTVQRTMAVLWPHRMKMVWTMRRTWIVVATLVLTALALNFHLLIGRGITKDTRCDAMPGAYQQFYDYIFSWMDLCTTSIVPSICLFVCDIILSFNLFKAVSSSSSIAARVESNVGTDSRRKVSYRTTVMVLAISCAFLVLTIPICASLIWYPYAHEDIVRYPKSKAKWQLLFTVSLQLMYTNSAINFFLYCLTGTKFRREFMSWIRCGTQSPSAPSVHETASEASKGRQS